MAVQSVGIVTDKGIKGIRMAMEVGLSLGRQEKDVSKLNKSKCMDFSNNLVASKEELEYISQLLNYTEGENLPYYDESEDMEQWKAKLPHWEQYGKIQYVTFRLSDSLPQSCLNNIKIKKESFELSHPRPWDEKTERKYSSLLKKWEDEYLDAGFGSCVLKTDSVRKILVDSLEFHNLKKYILLAYVVMPNHVHALMLMRNNNKVSNVLNNIKRFSAKEINKILNRHGSIWSPTWDRIVRSRQHLKHCVAYIKENPRYLPKERFQIGGYLIKGY